MLTHFNNTPQLEVYMEAVRLKGFSVIAETFLAGIDSTPGLTDLQKTAIRLAAEKLPYYPDSSPMVPDGELLGVLHMSWENVGLGSSVPALTTEQRQFFFAGIMDVCKGIITAETTRLATLAGTDTALPADWAQTPAEEVEAEANSA